MDKHRDVRGAAVEELARGWKSEPATLPLVKDRALSDDSEDVRQAAVQELARGWKSDPDTLPLLRECIRTAPADTSSWCLDQLKSLIKKGWAQEPE